MALLWDIVRTLMSTLETLVVIIVAPVRIYRRFRVATLSSFHGEMMIVDSLDTALTTRTKAAEPLTFQRASALK